VELICIQVLKRLLQMMQQLEHSAPLAILENFWCFKMHLQLHMENVLIIQRCLHLHAELINGFSKYQDKIFRDTALLQLLQEILSNALHSSMEKLYFSLMESLHLILNA